MAFKSIPKTSDGVEVKSLRRLVEFFHIKLGEPLCMELASCIVVLKHRKERVILQEIIECCRFKVSLNCSLNCIVVQVAAQIQEAKGGNFSASVQGEIHFKMQR